MQKLFVRDFSDYDASGEVYIYEMCRLPSSDTNQDGKIDDDDITDGDPWSTYVPKSSSRIQFSAFDSANSLFGVWGYNSWRASDSDIVGDCPQQRPLKNEFFTENATVYHIAGNDSDNTRTGSQAARNERVERTVEGRPGVGHRQQHAEICCPLCRRFPAHAA